MIRSDGQHKLYFVSIQYFLKFISPINITSLTWLALNPNQAFHIVVCLVKIGLVISIYYLSCHAD